MNIFSQIYLMFTASLMFAMMGIFIKFASQNGASLSQIIIFRSIPSIIFLIIWIYIKSKKINFSNYKHHILRNLFGNISMWCGFYSISNLPLSTANSLNYTGPIFIAIWSILFDSFNKNLGRLLIIVIGFIGVIVILRPDNTNYHLLPLLIGIFSGMLSGISMIQINKLGKIGEPDWQIVLFFSISICSTGLLSCIYYGWNNINIYAYIYLLLVGLTGLFGQIALTKSFSKGSIFISSSLQYLTIIFAIILDIVIYGEYLNLLSILGIFLILLSNILSVFINFKK